MDLNLIRSLITLALFIIFMILIFQVFSRKNKKHYDDAANLVFEDGDERSQSINAEKNKVE